jgi:hypothetical protein
MKRIKHEGTKALQQLKIEGKHGSTKARKEAKA